MFGLSKKEKITKATKRCVEAIFSYQCFPRSLSNDIQCNEKGKAEMHMQAFAYQAWLLKRLYNQIPESDRPWSLQEGFISVMRKADPTPGHEYTDGVSAEIFQRVNVFDQMHAQGNFRTVEEVERRVMEEGNCAPGVLTDTMVAFKAATQDFIRFVEVAFN